MLVEHFDVEADAFLGGEGVHIPADGVDLPRDFLCRTVLGPFEYHVLDEVGDTVPLRSFIAGTSLQPDTYRGRTNMLHLFGDDGQPIGQLLTTNVPYFFRHCSLQLG